MTDWADDIAGNIGYPDHEKELAQALRKAKADGEVKGLRRAAYLVEQKLGQCYLKATIDYAADEFEQNPKTP